MNKIQKIGKGKRDYFSPKGRQVEEASLIRIKAILGDLEIRRDHLIEGLHKVQDHYGSISAQDLAALAEIFRLSQAEVNEVASFYHHFQIVRENEQVPSKSKLRICDGVSCEMAGSNELFDLFCREFSSQEVDVQKVPCIGRCASAPAARFDKVPIDEVTEKKVKEIYLTKSSYRLRLPRYEKFDDYVSRGGYAVFKKIKNKQIDEKNIINFRFYGFYY